MKTNVEIKKLENGLDLPLPSYATEQSAGMDLYAAINEPITIKAKEMQIIPCGISIGLPKGFEAQIRPRSGLAAKYGITVLNSPGTIDSDYRGEIKVILINHSNQDFKVDRGMRVAQAIIARHEVVIWEEVDSHDDTARGVQGFGSTGH